MATMRGLLGLLALGVFSCQSIENTSPIATGTISTPKIWSAAQSGQHAKISSGWLREFNNFRMTRLVNEALTHNHDLKAAAYRLRAAREGTIIGRSARLPSLSTSAGYSRRNSRQTPTTENYSLTLNASWEPDLWGRLRNLEKASRARYAATLADFRGARLSLAANTARAWCNLVTAERQLDLAERTLESYQDALPSVEGRYLSNLLRSVDLQFARNNVTSAKRTIRIRKLNRDNAARALELLLGRYPSSTVASSTKLPTLSKNIPAGLPSQLLARRPDLQAARADLYASAQRSEATRKNLLPSLNLTGSASNGADNIRRALDPNFLVYSVASSLAQTIYRGGRLSAEARAALAENRAAVHDYVRIALRAFQEVENALAADISLKQQEILLTKEVEQTGIAEKRALSEILLGIEGSSFLEYLEAQRRAENARASLIRLRNDRLQNRIDLHLALGGDFKHRGE